MKFFRPNYGLGLGHRSVLLSRIIQRQNEEAMHALLVNTICAVLCFIVTFKAIPIFLETFINVNLYGYDMSKREKKKIPEALGVICGAIYLIVMFLFIPFPFVDLKGDSAEVNFAHRDFIQFIGALLAICCMIFLGFADDVLNLKWRHKLWLPTIASLPLLMVYYSNIANTTIIVPKLARVIFGGSLDLGPLYYIYMGMLAVFCTNAINILSGINGLEVGQSVVICISIIIHNIIELNGPVASNHMFSLYFMLPFFGATIALLYYNWYPSLVFVGDTYCYFAGMTFAVVGILGHFSKTMILFFIPQVLNFLYSVPQIFKLVPCPRHRLPKYDPVKDKVGMSFADFEQGEVGQLGMLILKFCQMFGVLHVEYKQGEDGKSIRCNNFTIINLVLKIFGPMHERNLTIMLLLLQTFCTGIAFFIRYYVSAYFY